MLGQVLIQEVYEFLLIFTRIGAAFMFMPGFGATYVPMRVRLSLSLAITLVLVPLLRDMLPPMPPQAMHLVVLVAIEATAGIFMALVMQFYIAALHLAGNKIGMSIGYGNAMAFDPTTQNQSSIVNSFLGIMAIVLIFLTDIHHLMFEAVIDSYTLFVPGQPLPLGDFSNYLSKSLTKAFHLGFQLASPFVVFQLVLYTGMGMVSRLMPQLNIFFLTLPFQVMMGAALMMIAVPTLMMWFLKYYEDGLINFLQP